MVLCICLARGCSLCGKGRRRSVLGGEGGERGLQGSVGPLSTRGVVLLEMDYLLEVS